MSVLRFEHGGRHWRVDVEHPIDLSIPLDFAGPQPQFFGAPPARATPLAAGEFTGRVATGSSCNCDTLTVTPHCNGTHTECIGHITREPVSVNTVVPRAPVPCRVVTVHPVPFANSADERHPPSAPEDLVIDRRLLEAELPAVSVLPGLVIRTLPNAPDKRERSWDTLQAPYLTEEAAAYLASIGIEHLIVDLPSLDRADDGGRLVAHRRYWGLAADAVTSAAATRGGCTVTELAYAAADVSDGDYLLSLQVAPFASDAAPSRPVLLRLLADD